MTAFYGIYAFIGNEAVRRFDAGSGAAGLIAMLYGIGFAIPAFASGRLGARLDSVRLPWCFALLGICYLGMTLPIDYGGLLAAALFWGFAQHLAQNRQLADLSGDQTGSERAAARHEQCGHVSRFGARCRGIRTGTREARLRAPARSRRCERCAGDAFERSREGARSQLTNRSESSVPVAGGNDRSSPFDIDELIRLLGEPVDSGGTVVVEHEPMTLSACDRSALGHTCERSAGAGFFGRRSRATISGWGDWRKCGMPPRYAGTGGVHAGDPVTPGRRHRTAPDTRTGAPAPLSGSARGGDLPTRRSAATVDWPSRRRPSARSSGACRAPARSNRRACPRARSGAAPDLPERAPRARQVPTVGRR